MNRVVPRSSLIRSLIVSATCALAAQNAAAANLDGSGVSPDVLSLPKGPGSIEGLGAAFQPNLATGTGAYSIAIEVPPGPAGIKPQLALGYQSGRGNGVCGVGWDLDLPRVQRRVDEGLPEYQDADTFLSPEGEPLLVQSDQSWRSQIETTFSRFWSYAATGWKEELKDGRSRRYGRTAGARISNAVGKSIQDFAWLLEEEADVNGNLIRYVYERDQGQLYLSEVHWAEHKGQAGHEVQFSYESRPDALIDYRSTFSVGTARRLHSILVSTSGKSIRSYVLDYDDTNGSSLLTRVTKFDQSGKVAYPAVDQFKYTNFEPQAAAVRTLSGVPPVGFGTEAELADMDADGLPDIVQTKVGRHSFRRNEGNDHFAAERVFSDLSFTLGDSAQLTDIDGDGRIDLLVQPSLSPGDTRYFPSSGVAGWGDGVFFEGESIGAGIADPSLRFLDVDFDKRVDAVVSTATSFLVWRNEPSLQTNGAAWAYVGSIPMPEVGVGFAYGNAPEPNVQLADLNGDRLLDLVQLRPGGVRYFPQRGRMSFDPAIDMTGVPSLDTSAGLWRLIDVNGDGLSDLVLVGQHQVQLRLNVRGTAFAKAITVMNTPSIVDGQTVRFADVDGSGTTDIVWAAPDGWSYLELCAQGVPNLLTQVENGLGKTTVLSYASSAALDAADAREGNAWATHIPMPVQLLTSIETRDAASGISSQAAIEYRDGYYDGARKQFRGFASVIQTDLGDESTPNLITESNFDLGRGDEALKGRRLLLERRGIKGGVFDQTATAYEVKALATGGRAAFASSEEERIVEQGLSPIVVRDEYVTDAYGNQTLVRKLGDVEAAGDERITKRQFVPLAALAPTAQPWILDRVDREEIQDGKGHTQAVSYSYYDGDPFVGLPLGKVARGNLTRTVGCLGPPSDNFSEGRCSVDVMRKSYDDVGNVIGSRDAEDGERSYDYDSDLRSFPVRESVTVGGKALTFEATYDPGFGVPTQSTDPNGAVSQYSYDGFGRLVGVAKALDDTDNPSLTYEYELGNPISRRVTHLARSASAVETSIECIDGLGRTVEKLRDAGEQGYLVSEATDFDTRGNARKRHHPQFVPDGLCGSGLADVPAQTYSYDAIGRVLTTENFDQTKTRTIYSPLSVTHWDEEDADPGSPHADTPTRRRMDGLGRLIEVHETLRKEDVETLFAYDPQDRRVAVTDAAGATTSWAYDGLGRVTSVDHPDAGHIAYTYDKAGRRLSQTDARGRIVNWTYDEAGRVTSKQYLNDPLGTLPEEYHYDEPAAEQPSLRFTAGKLSWVKDASGSRYVGYDAQGRVATVTRTMGGHNFTEWSWFDQADHEVRRLRPDGSIANFGYDLRGELNIIDGVVDHVAFDEFGHPIEEALHNGVVSSMQYDVRGRLRDAITTGAARAPLQHLSYALDGVGNITTLTDSSQVAIDGAKFPVDSWTYQYDDLYRLTAAGIAGGDLAYAYDQTGTLLSIDGSGSETTHTHRYTYGGGQPHAPTAIDDRPMSVDASGNWETDGERALSWDSESRLAAVTSGAGAELARYTYDSDGSRAIRRTPEQDDFFVFPDYEVRGGKATTYTMIGGRRVAWSTSDVRYSSPVDIAPVKISAENEATEAVDGTIDAADAVVLLQVVEGTLKLDGAPSLDVDGDGAVAEADVRALLRIAVGAIGSAPVSFAVTDHLGSATLQLDQGGNPTSVRRYQPYGALRATQGDGSPYGYSGKEKDTESSLDYFGARYLHSEYALWTAVDPVALDGSRKVSSYSPYLAFAASPIVFVDPDGREVVLSSKGEASIEAEAKSTVDFLQSDNGKATIAIAIGAVAICSAGTSLLALGTLESATVGTAVRVFAVSLDAGLGAGAGAMKIAGGNETLNGRANGAFGEGSESLGLGNIAGGTAKGIASSLGSSELTASRIGAAVTGLTEAGMELGKTDWHEVGHSILHGDVESRITTAVDAYHVGAPLYHAYKSVSETQSTPEADVSSEAP